MNKYPVIIADPPWNFQDYYMRLGYTDLMLQRRQEREWEAVK